MALIPTAELSPTSPAPLPGAGTTDSVTSRRVDFLGLLAREGLSEADAKKRLIKMLEATHPLFVVNRKLLKMLGDVAINRISTEAHKKEYLVQGHSERDILFKQRTQLAEFLPETPGLLSDFVGAVFSKPARREFIKDDKGKEIIDKALRDRIKSFWDAAGPEGQPISRMAKEAAKQALIFNSVDALLDHPTADENEEGTNIPHMVLFTPEQRLDWEFGDDGYYKWVKYKEVFTERDNWSGARQQIEEYRVITAPEGETKGRMMLFRVTKTKKNRRILAEVEEVANVEHEFSSIPIRTLWWDRDETVIGSSWIRPLVMADLKTFRQESDLTWDVFTHAHPGLKAWLHPNEDDPDGKGKTVVDELNLGGAHAFHLDPGTEEGRPREDLEYLAKFTDDLRIQAELIADTRKTVRRLAGNDSDLEVDKGGQPESGVALAYRQAQRAKNFVQLAQALQEWVWQLTELVVNEFEKKDIKLEGVLEIVYPDSFDQRLTDELAADFTTAKEIGVDELLNSVKKKLAARIAGEGTSASMMDKINEAIEQSSEVEAATQAAEKAEGEEGAEEPKEVEAEQAITFNELTLGAERFTNLGDLEMLNMIRETIAGRLGHNAPKDLTEQDLPEANVGKKGPVPPQLRKPKEEEVA